jgi:nucleoside-diphosphate-sugar epimerase
VNGTVAIVGASGLVGSAICERLFFEGCANFRPFVHSTGSGWRLARLPLQLHTLDLMDRAQAEAALAGCSVVINCSRGGPEVMITGLKNLIQAAKINRVQRFIHISSAAIYGLDPHPDAVSESGPLKPGDSYSHLKARQDRMVLDLHRTGLASYILCPGNIAGPYSAFSRSLVSLLASGTMALVDDGVNPCNVVHVDNLAEAALLAARSDRGAGERYFVNEVQPISCKRYFEDNLSLGGMSCEFVSVSRDRVLAASRATQIDSSIAAHVKTAFSGEFRKALAMMPVFARSNEIAGRIFQTLPRGAQQWARTRLERPTIIRPVSDGPVVNHIAVRGQVRRVFHDPKKLIANLGFEPVLSYEKGLETIWHWLRFIRAI